MYEHILYCNDNIICCSGNLAIACFCDILEVSPKLNFCSCVCIMTRILSHSVCVCVRVCNIFYVVCC